MYKKIEIGKLISDRMAEQEMGLDVLANKINSSVEQLEALLNSDDLSCKMLLKLSKILDYDFFRIYSMNLLLYSPLSMGFRNQFPGAKTTLPRFARNTYTPQIIGFILKKYESGEMTPVQILEVYHIPKTTLYRWLKKYNTKKDEL